MFESHKHLEVVKVLETANLSVLENVSSDLQKNSLSKILRYICEVDYVLFRNRIVSGAFGGSFNENIEAFYDTFWPRILPSECGAPCKIWFVYHGACL